MPDDSALRLDNQLCFSLYSASLAMTQLYKPHLEPLGLTYPQYLVLLILWEQDGIGLKDIGARLRQKSGALTPVIKRLEQDGLVRRVRLAGNERQLDIRLTERGHALKTEAAHINRCVAEECGMPTSDMKALKDRLDQLRANLQTTDS
ncbi:MAG: MarR family transcriptional regulator [Marinobacter sp.]|uniref:MarR family winged helix-turn-helix transcriptional regulator n=1 Tax=Marinobacter sp. TaxID=50741 RepID=UPI00299E0601|nr:MarR family transcriptional regulator [Marinobacter sp.]MDX1634005.1 MarR family transcriptional regulator [Marinobacter sp.]